VSLLFADYDAISVKDSRFAAAGDGATDDTAALQAALDHCFGSAGTPHGSAGVYQNKALYIPPGHYKITAPLTIKYLHGGRIIGAGRFVTQIENTAGSSVLITNGCGYSRFEGMRLTGAAGSRIFDLDWDNSAGGPALQSNTFADLFFDGGAIGIEIGRSGFMGSENLFLNCFWELCSTAGLITSNANALQQTVIGGNFQTCGTGVFVGVGSVPVIKGVGFQQGIIARKFTCQTSAAGSDPAGVRFPSALFEARALLGLMASYEAARRCSDYSVMAGVVASGTADDGALQASLGRGRRCQR
jgi:Pectate lyase superfamily protein